MVRILNIEPELLALRDMPRKGGTDIHLTFKRYEACIKTIEKLKVSPKSDWPYSEKPTHLDIAAIWVQKTQYKLWDNNFGPILASYPEMAKWLRKDPDAKSAEEIWTSKFRRYSLNSLKDWLKAQRLDAKKSPKKKKPATL